MSGPESAPASGQQKTALVTGAAGAIGTAIARRLAELGLRLILLDIAAAPLEALAAELPDAEPIVLDLSDLAAVRATAEAVAKRHGGVDILVNNAAILSNNKIATTSLEEWRHVSAINTDAVFALCQGVLPGMRTPPLGPHHQHLVLCREIGRPHRRNGLCRLQGRDERAHLLDRPRDGGGGHHRQRHRAGLCDVADDFGAAHRDPAPPAARPDPGRPLLRAGGGRPRRRLSRVPLAGFITGEVIDMNGGLHFD